MTAATFGPPDVLVVVHGLPVTQGSKRIGRARHTGKPILLDDSRDLAGWRSTVTSTAALTLPRGWQPLVGPVAVLLAFGLPRPVSHPKGSRTWPTARRDIDKLTRAVLDAFKVARVYRDDGQVVADYSLKDWHPNLPGLTRPGLLAAVWRITDGEHLRGAPTLTDITAREATA